MIIYYVAVVTLLLGLTIHSPWSISAKSLSASLNDMFLNAGCTITRFTYSEEKCFMRRFNLWINIPWNAAYKQPWTWTTLWGVMSGLIKTYSKILNSHLNGINGNNGNKHIVPQSNLLWSCTVFCKHTNTLTKQINKQTNKSNVNLNGSLLTWSVCFLFRCFLLFFVIVGCILIIIQIFRQTSKEK